MKLDDIILKAEKEAYKVKINLDNAIRNNAPQKDIDNLKEKLEFKEGVLKILKVYSLRSFYSVILDDVLSE